MEFAFSRFVAEHAAQALLWCVVPVDGKESQSRINHVEFDSNRCGRSSENTEEYDGFGLEVRTRGGQLGAGVSLVRYPGHPLTVKDEHYRMSAILDDPRAHNPNRQLRSAVRLVEYLKRLEDQGYLVPAWKRRGSFS